MKFTGKASDAAEKIIGMFQTGNVPKALSQVFITRPTDSRPCCRWSWSNRFLMVLSGTQDARGFRQWQEVGRSVKKGSKAIHILGPNMIRKESKNDAGESVTSAFIAGFHAVPVFRIEDTEGQELPGVTEDRAFFDSLPFVEVARAWGISLSSFNATESSAKGWYGRGAGTYISLGVENQSTWAHELIHAAEDRLGALNNGKSTSTRRNEEIVAELGGAVLLSMIGQDEAADIGGCWQYVESWTGGKDSIGACMAMLNRVCAAVDLIIQESEKVSANA